MSYRSMGNLTLPFTQAEFEAAYREWGCNCGPSALAFALQVKLDVVRPAIPDFETRRYTSPTMMAAALSSLGASVEKVRNPSPGQNIELGIAAMFTGPLSLVRVQWMGPWTDGGKPARWAATHTHWIVTWRRYEKAPTVFDCNSGIVRFEYWRTTVAKSITDTIKNADGYWYATNVWRLLA